MSQQKIKVTSGAIEYTFPWTATETTGKNISTSTVQLALGSYDEPGDWVTPVVSHPTTSSVTAKMLIDNNTPVGTYWLWRSISDTPEVIPKRLSLQVVVY